MTHAKLYNIVEFHRDVWGEHFHTVRRGDESTEFVRHYTNDAGEPEHVEMELLGLGVAWLVETEKQSRIYAKGRCCTGFGTMTNGRWLGQGDSILASVYSLIGRLKTSRAAIAEMKAKA